MFKMINGEMVKLCSKTIQLKQSTQSSFDHLSSEQAISEGEQMRCTKIH